MSNDPAAPAPSLPWAGAPETPQAVVAQCPACGWRYRVHQDAAAVCDGCRREVRFLVFRPSAPTRVTPEALPIGGGTPCAAHGTNLAVDACARCGVFMCVVCRTKVGESNLCPACVDRVASAEGGLRRFSRGGFLWGSLTFHMGLLAFFASPILAPLGVATALIGWFRGPKPLAPGQGWRLAVGFALSLAWLGITIAVIVSMVAVRNG